MNAHVKPTPLPTTVAELEARKTMRAGPSLNDDVDRIHRALWVDPDYRKWHSAVWNEDAIEGSCTADNFFAALMIRDYARREEFPELNYIGRKNVTTIVKSMTVVLKRYHMTRKERAQTVDGEIVPDNGNVGE